MTEKLNVYECIAKCAQEIATTGIAKDRKNDMQGYKFRGIDDVYNALAPIISKNGLVILPRVISRNVVERPTKSGGVMFYTTVECEFDFVSMFDQSKHIVKTYGEAMDSGDKSTNKAMSAAYKYACMQAFCIPTEGDNDADGQTHEVVQEKFTPEQKSIQATLITKIQMCNSPEEIDSLMDEHKSDFDTLPEEMNGLVNDTIGNRKEQIAKNIHPVVNSHKYAGVNDANNWMKKMKPVIDGFKSSKALIQWQAYNQPFINGLTCLDADKYKVDGKTPKERLTDALSAKLGQLTTLETSQAPIG